MLGEKLKYLNEHDWITIWPTISVILFTIIFLYIVYTAIKFKKKDVAKWESMPLDENQDTQDNLINKTSF
ncbi:MAG: hypothetical protein L3J35_05145 [Bacteroidales bacterium]|nr:hypothetical protein [Bacteroidales bacterium]